MIACRPPCRRLARAMPRLGLPRRHERYSKPCSRKKRRERMSLCLSEPNEMKLSGRRRRGGREQWRGHVACPFLTCVFELGPSAPSPAGV